MSVLHDYKCLAHGYFEAWDAQCPHGCSGDSIQKVFLQAVGIKSDSTKRNDATLNNLATDYGMTDLHTPRDGESQMDAAKRQNNPFAIQWAKPTDIGNYNTAPIADESTNGLQLGRDTGKLNPLKPSVITRDHENLSIEK